uniref:Uncharacterized protein n=1 Tax=Pristionchus pacificus TaxID=54126 RepID=A0A2A6BIF5_PRIPA|eukprot:PDM65684.1 hypothetical protein PRIPAC_45598 [Pristionchus pacificus]
MEEDEQKRWRQVEISSFGDWGEGWDVVGRARGFSNPMVNWEEGPDTPITGDTGKVGSCCSAFALSLTSRAFSIRSPMLDRMINLIMSRGSKLHCLRNIAYQSRIFHSFSDVGPDDQPDNVQWKRREIELVPGIGMRRPRSSRQYPLPSTLTTSATTAIGSKKRTKSNNMVH